MGVARSPDALLPDLVDTGPGEAGSGTACPFLAMGCPAVCPTGPAVEAHLRAAAQQHLQLLCTVIHRNAKVLAEQQERIERLMQRSPLEVDPSGSAMFKTIAEALLVAEDGDRILIHEGLYREALVVERRVTLQAAGPVTVENAAESNVLVVRTTCTVSGLTLRQRSKHFFCLRLMGPNATALVERCDIASEHFSCLQIDSGCNPTIRTNKIHDSQQCGILIKKHGKGQIHDNDIYGNCLANVYVDAHADPVVTGNRVHHSAQHGVWVKQRGKGLFEENTVYNNGMANLRIEEGAAPTVRNNYVS